MRLTLFVALCLLTCARTTFAQTIQPANPVVLADALLAAKTETEQAALLAATPQFVNLELCRALATRGDERLKQRQFDPALAAFALTLNVARRLNDTAWQAKALSKQGTAAHQANRFQPAAEFHQQSLPLFRALGDALGEAEALRNLGMAQRNMGQYPQALDNYRLALALAERLGDNLQLARTLNSLSIISRLLGQKEQSLDYAKQALARFETADDKVWIAGMQLSLGNTYGELGDMAAARAAYEKGLRLSEALQDQVRIASFVSQLALLSHKQGDYRTAQTLYERSLMLARQLNDNLGAANTLSNLGSLHFAQGNYVAAIEYETEALARYRKAGARPEESATLNNIADALFEQGKYDECDKYLQQALPISQAIGRIDIEAMIVQKQAHLHRFAGRKAEALAAYQRALTLNEARGEDAGLAIACGNLAVFLSYGGQHSEAVPIAERALALTAKYPNVEIEWAMRFVLGRAQRANGQLEQARRNFDETIQLVETLRDHASLDAANRSHFLVNKLAGYHEQISLLVAQGQSAAALQYAERAKARALFDVLQQSPAEWNKTLTAAERADETRFKQTMNTLNAELLRARGQANVDETQVAELTTRLQKARLAYEELQTRLATAHPELNLQPSQAPLFQLATAAALVPDTRTALLEFAYTTTQVYLFVITRAPQLKLDVFELPLPRAQLDNRVEELLQLLATRNLDFRAAAVRLYSDLLKPAQAVLQGKTQLVIVPDDHLWELPFQALHDGQQYLVERAALSYAPSLTVLDALQKLRRPRTNAAPTLLAFGNPTVSGAVGKAAGPAVGDATAGQTQQLAWRAAALAPLPQAETEVNALARLYGARHSRVYVGAAAREDRFKAEAGRYDVVHIAAHGLLDDAKPLYSQVVLATQDKTEAGLREAGLREAGLQEDGLLEAWELLKLKLHPDLVVLSACETARGNVVAGEGVIGLSWALFVAGAPTVVVSQWKVDADATTELMIEFHRQLRQRTTNTKAEALRQASLKLLRGAQRHPFYWAGFVAVGAAN